VGRKACVASFTAALLLAGLLASRVFGDDPKPLRVCADPDNLPFSNQQGQGFENKIAELVAKELRLPLGYYWWPHQRGLVRNTLRADQCDVLIGIPTGYDPVLWTKPYYRSAYVVAYPKGRGFDIRSLDAPVLRQVRIGVHSNTPPEEALARRGILQNVVGYSLFYDPRGSSADRPSKLVMDLVTGEIDVGVAWGPLVGYFAKKLNAPLEVVPLVGDPRVPLTFDISMGVKKGNQALKGKLEDVLDRRQSEIRRVLDEYGVPQVPEDTAPGKESGGREKGAGG
jgi:mxaJ protein